MELLTWQLRMLLPAEGYRDDGATDGPRVDAVSAPLYQLKAEFFKTLGHPARIRVLELLSERDHAVAEMLPEVGIEPAHLSQQLAVLRRAGLVVSRKQGGDGRLLADQPRVAELLAVAREILTGVLSGQAELLDEMRSSGPPGGGTRAADRASTGVRPSHVMSC